jgi:hypothetical protein
LAQRDSITDHDHRREHHRQVGETVRSMMRSFIPGIDDNAVTGRATVGMRASRSAAIVALVLIRAW